MKVLRDIQLGSGVSIGDGKILFLSIQNRGTIIVQITVGSEVEIRKLNQEEIRFILKKGGIWKTKLRRGEGIILGKERDLEAGCPLVEIHIIKSEGSSRVGIIANKDIKINKASPLCSITASN